MYYYSNDEKIVLRRAYTIFHHLNQIITTTFKIRILFSFHTTACICVCIADGLREWRVVNTQGSGNRRQRQRGWCVLGGTHHVDTAPNRRQWQQRDPIPPPSSHQPTSAVADTDADDALGCRRQPYYAYIANAAEVESHRPTLWYGLRRTSSLAPLPTRDLHGRTPILAMVRPPVTTKLLLGLYSLFYSCTIALDGK